MQIFSSIAPCTIFYLKCVEADFGEKQSFEAMELTPALVKKLKNMTIIYKKAVSVFLKTLSWNKLL